LIATNAGIGNLFTVTLDQNVTFSNPTNSTDGQRITWRIVQNATGNFTLALGSNFEDPTGFLAGIPITANSVSYLVAIFYNATTKWHILPPAKGYS
jgi:hypothetical protein